jgi:ribosomal-protein-alanine N-acetyltransferase
MNATGQTVSTLQEFGNDQSLYAFLKGNHRTHAHLDWRSPLEWLEKTPSCIYHNGAHIDGVLSLAPDPVHYHWVRFFSLRNELSPANVWKTLFGSILDSYQFASADMITALCYQNWMETLLFTHGWKKVQKVIVLTWQGILPQKYENDSSIMMRKMKLDDLQQVIHIDDLCFDTYWKFSPTTLTLAFEQSGYSSVAVMDDRIVGFQISSADLYRAHLVRLAVLPEFRKHGIGARLVSNMLWHFSMPWIRQITVNTQYDNEASIHLYRHSGFEYQGEFFPIFQYPNPLG